MNHEMGLYPENFKNIKSGQKKREYRLYDEKRQKIRIGDTITFINTETKEKIVVNVLDMLIYKNFKNCYNDFWEEDFANRGQTLEQIILNTYTNWWSKDLEEKYGCVVIKIELCNQGNKNNRT